MGRKGRWKSPTASIIVPTYNRDRLLRLTLSSLAAQTLPVSQFEVIVVDDGSTDATPSVVRGFQDRLRLTYVRQEDQGFRAAAARNAGAARADAPLLVFLDSGVQAGPELVAGYVRHAAPRRIVLGYTYGSEPSKPIPGLAEAINEMSPQELLHRYRHDRAFWDGRHDRLAVVGFDADRCAFPWTLLWSLNFSLSVVDFWSVGGFDEDFRGWGMEDLELGYRLSKKGHSFLMSPGSWAIESPHQRDHEANVRSNRLNIIRFLLKHPDPVLELYLAWSLANYSWSLEAAYDSLQAWTRDVADLVVTNEIETAIRRLPPGGVAAVLGCGDWRPAPAQPHAAFDFDPRHAGPIERDSCPVRHAVGIRTPLTDKSVDLVIVTSRLVHPWKRYGRHIRAEAERIGRSVWLSPHLDEDDSRSGSLGSGTGPEPTPSAAPDRGGSRSTGVGHLTSPA